MNRYKVSLEGECEIEIKARNRREAEIKYLRQIDAHPKIHDKSFEPDGEYQGNKIIVEMGCVHCWEFRPLLPGSMCERCIASMVCEACDTDYCEDHQ